MPVCSLSLEMKLLTYADGKLTALQVTKTKLLQ